MSGLRREHAPFSRVVWDQIDEEASEVMKASLAGRKLVDLNGPLGWQASSINIGRTDHLDSQPVDGVEARLRRSQPLVELCVPFVLSRAEIDAIERGAADADLGPAADAARRLALAEDGIIFNGYSEAGIDGLIANAAHDPKPLSTDFAEYAGVVANALEILRMEGVGGPYAIALGPRCFSGLTKTMSAGGYPLMDHIRRLIDGPIVFAPAVDGAVVMSIGGEDFELTLGRDISIGYRDHCSDSVTLYLVESMTFRSLAPEAVVPLRYAD